jgi:hypothetical protein
MNLPRRGRRQVATYAAGAIAAVAYVTQILLGFRLPGWLQLTIAAVGVVSTFVGIWLPSRAAVSARHVAERAASTQRQELQDLLAPVISLIGQITAESQPDQRRQHQVEIRRLITDSASDYIGGARTRACFFEYRSGPPAELVPISWKGRDSRPLTVFREDTDRGDSVIKMLQERKSIFYQNLDLDAPPGFPAHKPYKTFIATTVAGGDKIFGMLAIDGLSVGDLTEHDEVLMRLLAQLLSAGLAC